LEVSGNQPQRRGDAKVDGKEILHAVGKFPGKALLCEWIGRLEEYNSSFDRPSQQIGAPLAIYLLLAFPGIFGMIHIA
jgi:hypothetical protein